MIILCYQLLNNHTKFWVCKATKEKRIPLWSWRTLSPSGTCISYCPCPFFPRALRRGFVSCHPLPWLTPFYFFSLSFSLALVQHVQIQIRCSCFSVFSGKPGWIFSKMHIHSWILRSPNQILLCYFFLVAHKNWFDFRFKLLLSAACFGTAYEAANPSAPFSCRLYASQAAYQCWNNPWRTHLFIKPPESLREKCLLLICSSLLLLALALLDAYDTLRKPAMLVTYLYNRIPNHKNISSSSHCKNINVLHKRLIVSCRGQSCFWQSLHIFLVGMIHASDNILVPPSTCLLSLGVQDWWQRWAEVMMCSPVFESHHEYLQWAVPGAVKWSNSHKTIKWLNPVIGLHGLISLIRVTKKRHNNTVMCSNTGGKIREEQWRVWWSNLGHDLMARLGQLIVLCALLL